jgi:hypothetical protein
MKMLAHIASGLVVMTAATAVKGQDSKVGKSADCEGRRAEVTRRGEPSGAHALLEKLDPFYTELIELAAWYRVFGSEFQPLR